MKTSLLTFYLFGLSLLVNRPLYATTVSDFSTLKEAIEAQDAAIVIGDDITHITESLNLNYSVTLSGNSSEELRGGTPALSRSLFTITTGGLETHISGLHFTAIQAHASSGSMRAAILSNQQNGSTSITTVHIAQSQFSNISTKVEAENDYTGGQVFGGVLQNRYEQAHMSIVSSSFIGNEARLLTHTSDPAEGGVIWNKDGATLSITGQGELRSEFKNNTAFSQGGSALGGVIYNGSAYGGTSSTVTIVNTDFTGNTAHSTGGTVWSYGGAIHNTSYSVARISNATFNGNSVISETSSAHGGAISNSSSSSLFVENTLFTGNIADNRKSTLTNRVAAGGAISNLARAYVTDSQFIANEVWTTVGAAEGGAISNGSYNSLFIIANNVDTIFTGNTANGESNALFNSGTSYLNANANTNASIIFNDKISGDSQKSLEINKSNITSLVPAPTSGVIQFNNTVTNQNIKIYDGTLRFGEYAGMSSESLTVPSSQGALSSVSLTALSGATIDIATASLSISSSDINLDDGSILRMDISDILVFDRIYLDDSTIAFDGDLSMDIHHVDLWWEDSVKEYSFELFNYSNGSTATLNELSFDVLLNHDSEMNISHEFDHATGVLTLHLEDSPKIPEPSSTLLMLLACVSAATRRRRIGSE